MSAHALPSKLGPQRAFTSTVHADERFVHSDASTDEILKRRFRDAYMRWRNAGGDGREMFADSLGAKFNQVKRWLSESEATKVPPEMVLIAERLAQESRLDGLTDQEIAQAVRDHARAEAAMQRIRERLIEAAA